MESSLVSKIRWLAEQGRSISGINCCMMVVRSLSVSAVILRALLDPMLILRALVVNQRECNRHEQDKKDQGYDGAFSQTASSVRDVACKCPFQAHKPAP
jgi:hypothetical protein